MRGNDFFKLVRISMIITVIIGTSIDYNNIKNPQYISGNTSINKKVCIDKFYTINTVMHCSFDFVVYEDLIYSTSSAGFQIIDISRPAKAQVIYQEKNANLSLARYITRYNDKILFSARHYDNFIGIVNCEINATLVNILTTIDLEILKLIIINDELFIFGSNDYGSKLMLTYDLTDFNNWNLIGNTTRNFSFNDVIMDEERVFVITGEQNLAIYEVNSALQLDFVVEYEFDNLNSISLSDDQLNACDNMGLKIYEILNDNRLNCIANYTLENAKSAHVSENIVYLVTEREILTLDKTNLEHIIELDKHSMEDRLKLEYKKIVMINNICIIITEDWIATTFYYSWFLFIYDVTNPERIKRLFPMVIPLTFETKMIITIVSVIAVISIILIVIVLKVIAAIRIRTKKQLKKSE